MKKTEAPKIPKGVSHLSITQAAKFVGVTQPSAYERSLTSKMPAVIAFGVRMVRVRDCVRWRKERARAAK